MMKFDPTSMFAPEHAFRSEAEIRAKIRDSKNYAGEDPGRANLLLIFSTSKQRTYLVATEQRLYCILDDNRHDEPHVNWSLSRDEVTDGAVPTLEVSTRSKSDRTGLVDLGPRHRRWLYSKDLFAREPIEARVAGLLDRSMIKKAF